jgi:hypothetical protein
MGELSRTRVGLLTGKSFIVEEPIEDVREKLRLAAEQSFGIASFGAPKKQLCVAPSAVIYLQPVARSTAKSARAQESDEPVLPPEPPSSPDSADREPAHLDARESVGASAQHGLTADELIQRAVAHWGLDPDALRAASELEGDEAGADAAQAAKRGADPWGRLRAALR